MRAKVGSLPREDLSKYLLRLRTANEELHKLASSDAVDYGLPQIGDAYALKFHLMRADNLLIALEAASKKGAFSEHAHVMDIGSGTGSTSWALAAWAGARPARSYFEIASVEASREMTRTAAVLWAGLRRLGGRIGSASVCTSNDGQACDVLIANHLFSIPGDSEDARTQIRSFGQHACRVKKGGTAIILTPNVDEKIELTQEAVRDLSRVGFELLLDGEAAEPPKEVTNSQERRPQLLCAFRREIDALGGTLGVGKVFRDPEFDDPYYGFYGRLTVLRRKA